MSKQPLKKKRTILDFFTRSGKNTTTDGPVSKRQKTMAAKYPIESHEVSERREVSEEHERTEQSKPGPPETVKIEEIDLEVSHEVSERREVSEEHERTEQSEPGPSETVKIEDSDSEVEYPTEEDSQESSTSSVSDRIPLKKPSQIRDGSNAWKGIPLKMLDKLETTSKIKDSIDGNKDANHRVLFKTPWKYDGKNPPTPFPHFKDKWDHLYVKLPCSNQNEYPVTTKNGKSFLRRRWDMIQEELLKDIPGPYELEERILTYNSRYFGKWKFNVLHEFFRMYVTDEERDHFFNKVVKDIACLALMLPSLCSAPIPLLRERRNFSITFSQQQIACLLANAFFCTFPRRNAKGKSEYSKYPSINFNTLFTGPPSPVKFEKLKCIIHYFKRVCNKVPLGTVTFTRQHLDSSRLPDWEKDTTPLRALHVSSEGTIEDDGFGLLQVDFANKFLGGGVLGHGCVQEEIRFLICPEMIVSRLITESLGEDECLIMRGCERFSNYEGYASTFLWKENYEDKTPRDSWGRMQCEVVAIDALVFHDFKTQFMPDRVKRELTKAYCGFYHPGKRDKLPAVCTGNWGCGAFGGDKQLKAIIQLMAASKARRDLCYFTFDDEALRDELYNIHKFLTEKNLTIGETWSLIKMPYSDFLNYIDKKNEHKLSIFTLIAMNASALTPICHGSKPRNNTSHHGLSWAHNHNPHTQHDSHTGSSAAPRTDFADVIHGSHTHTAGGRPNKNLQPRDNQVYRQQEDGNSSVNAPYATGDPNDNMNF